MVKVHVVVDAVAMHPIGSSSSVAGGTDEIDVKAPRVVSYDPVVVHGLVVVLDQVVPSVPLPHDLSVIATHWFDLDDSIGPHIVLAAGRVACYGWVSSRLEGFLFRSFLPSDQQNVPIWHGFDVMV